MVFSNSNVSKPGMKTLYSSPSPTQTSSANTASVYYMQNSMIGRLMNTVKCAACPKH